MFNPRLTETLTDFPFARLDALIAPITPPAHLSMINLAVGEQQSAMPAFARQIVAEAPLKVLPGAYVCRETDGANTTNRYTRVALVHDEKTTRGAVMARRISCPGFMSLPRHTGEVPLTGAEGEGRSESASPFQIMAFQKSSVRPSPSGPAGHLPRKTGEGDVALSGAR